MAFHSVSSTVKTWMVEQPHVKEESLTDWLLFNVSKSIPTVYYQAFSRHEEAENGADWEWWVLTQNSFTKGSFNAYRFFVQAKKLTNVGDNYSRLNYGNKRGQQIDLLIDHAKTYHAFPFYMFYATSEPDLNEQERNIPFINREILAWCTPCENGCFLSDANEIYHLLYATGRPQLNEPKLLNHSFKLSLLDKLFMASGRDCERILSSFNEFMIMEKRKQSSSLYQSPGILGIKHFGNGIPSYLSLFVERHEEDLSWFESEMRRDMPDVGGISVIDLRDSENE